ncbi:cupin domain-containing protein [Rhizorhabdus argentea]|uniref:cupin domain-containing protein n=1 Tax=Rhizorhabdus argentea TaxID=1387174 RepID=UPI0030EE0BB8
MTDKPAPDFLAVNAQTVAPRTKPSGYPDHLRARVAGREKRALGDLFGLTNFGVNLTTLKPGAESALMHRHSRQDEFIYVLSGAPTLVTEAGEVLLSPGMCAGFAAAGLAHHLVNRSAEEVTYLEIGDRTRGDEGTFPQDDIRADLDANGHWYFSRNDGSRY